MVFFLLMLMAFSLKGQAQTSETPLPESKPIEIKAGEGTWSYKLISHAPEHWRFDIYRGELLLLNSNGIPGLENIPVYDSEKTATDMAALIINKLKKDGFPFPAVTQEELNKANIQMTLTPKN